MQGNERTFRGLLLVLAAVSTCPAIQGGQRMDGSAWTQQSPQGRQSPQGQQDQQVQQNPRMPEFDAVSIKRHMGDSGAVHMEFTTDRYAMNGVSLFTIISSSFDLKPTQILGGPGWLKTARFDVEAKFAPEDLDAVRRLSQHQVWAILAGVFSERFALKTHTETRDSPVYVLEAERGGARLRRSQDQMPGGGAVRFAGGGISGTSISMPGLAIMLSSVLGREVVDRTGLEGLYDIALSWNPEETYTGAEDGTPGASPGDKPTLFTALREQLGLRLGVARSSLKVLVIDHAEMPTSN